MTYYSRFSFFPPTKRKYNSFIIPCQTLFADFSNLFFLPFPPGTARVYLLPEIETFQRPDLLNAQRYRPGLIAAVEAPRPRKTAGFAFAGKGSRDYIGPNLNETGTRRARIFQAISPWDRRIPASRRVIGRRECDESQKMLSTVISDILHQFFIPDVLRTVGRRRRISPRV